MGILWEELFVRHVQKFLPTCCVRGLIRFHFKHNVRDSMRNGDKVLEQIRSDRAKHDVLPVTDKVEAANEQLYEVPSEFYLEHLGARLKYSACRWRASAIDELHGGFPDQSTKPFKTLEEAEDFTLQEYTELAGLKDLPAGSKVLEMGCGWGSNVLRAAENFPKLKFTAFSNSRTQISFIQNKAKEKNLSNLTALMEDYAIFATPQSKLHGQTFNAIFAIETIEHAQDIRSLLVAAQNHLVSNGVLFIHSLLHQTHSYLQDDTTWMGRNFFTGGSIIGLNSYFHFCPPKLHIEKMWPVNGQDYSLTLLAWLERMEAKKEKLVKAYGREHYENFRMFYIMCAEAFAANDGKEFMCGYYLFRKVA